MDYNKLHEYLRLYLLEPDYIKNPPKSLLQWSNSNKQQPQAHSCALQKHFCESKKSQNTLNFKSPAV